MSSAEMAAASSPPDGWRYQPDLIGADEEAQLVARIGELPFTSFVFRGVTARRRVVQIGWTYDFESRSLSPARPVDPWLHAVRERAGALGGLDPEALEEILITEYQPGATIGWHRDAPAFGATVIGVSLLSACRMRFKRSVERTWERYAQTLEPRSGYVLGGAARSTWQHSIPPTPALRYSITFRTLRRRPAVR